MGIWKQWSERWHRSVLNHGAFRTFNLKGTPLRLTGTLIILGLLGILLIFAGNRLVDRPAAVSPAETAATLGPGKTTAAEGQFTSFAAYEASLATELEAILTQIKGAGKVAVSITLDSGGEKVYAQNRTVTNRSIEEKDSGGGTRLTTETDDSAQMVIIRDTQSGAEKLVVVKEIRPEVSGVIVVAEGAGSSQVKADLTRAVQTVLGITAARVQVFVK